MVEMLPALVRTFRKELLPHFGQGERTLQKFCTCEILQKKDKYSLKNIGSNKPQVSGRRKKAPDYKRFGGSKEFPVSVFQLPRLDQNEIDLESGSKHKAMIENALHSAIECLIFSNELNDDVLTGCPIEITKVELASNFSSAFVYWKLDDVPGGPTEEEISQAFDQNLEFIRNMLPAYHSMTHTPLVTFVKDLKLAKEREIDNLLKQIELNIPNQG
ncbi:uncharacterized protein LOC135691356 [Rhopilema esculentum]|uniref:uncharacterized protein LOC135691356 n=1 Tax=Rhopilema esculentum TaxID=499914 RepID=UPI0031DEF0F2